MPGPATAQAPSPVVPGTPYRSLRYDEDFTFLRDSSRRDDPWDAVKWLDAGGAARLTLGGEYRARFEAYDPRGLGLPAGPGRPRQGGDAGVLHRLLGHADLRAGPDGGGSLRAFLQFGAHFVQGRAPIAPTDQDRLDLQQGFLDLRLPLGGDGGWRLTLRGGRQEVSFGAERLVSVREGPNVRRSFDGARAILEAAGLRLDAFALHPVEVRDGRAFDDRADPAQGFWGAYGTGRAGGALDLRLDLYYLGFRDARAAFAQGRGRELRHSVGARLWGFPGPWDYDLEAVYQFGRFADGAIRAWTVASDVGLTLRGLPWSPRLGLKLDYASGDHDPRDRALGTFNPLFPRSAYFTQGAFNAPANFYDVRPSLGLRPAPGLRVSVAYDALWRASTGDGFYAPPLVAAARPATGAGGRERFLGHQAEVLATWQVSRHVGLNAAYARFEPGTFLRGAGARGSDYVTVWLGYIF